MLAQRDQTVYKHRKISSIARDIWIEWSATKSGINYSALPYLEAMMKIDSINSMYFADRAGYVVTYFLANARQFKGERAKELKLELKALSKLEGKLVETY